MKTNLEQFHWDRKLRHNSEGLIEERGKNFGKIPGF
jgi:hypothetical protein